MDIKGGITTETLQTQLQTVCHRQVYLNAFKNQNALICHRLMQTPGGGPYTKGSMLTAIGGQNSHFILLLDSVK